jgi:hypothetical protein
MPKHTPLNIQLPDDYKLDAGDTIVALTTDTDYIPDEYTAGQDPPEIDVDEGKPIFWYDLTTNRVKTYDWAKKKWIDSPDTIRLVVDGNNSAVAKIVREEGPPKPVPTIQGKQISYADALNTARNIVQRKKRK